MNENWVRCAGANLPTALFHLCEMAQEKLSEKDPDYKKVGAEELLKAIDDKLAHSKNVSPLCIDKVSGIELDVRFKREFGTGQLAVDVASFDARYGKDAGKSAIGNANEAVTQAHMGCPWKAIRPTPAKKTILVCFALLASFVFAETEAVDYHTEVVDGIEWTYHINPLPLTPSDFNSALIASGREIPIGHTSGERVKTESPAIIHYSRIVDDSPPQTALAQGLSPGIAKRLSHRSSTSTLKKR